ncbi:hypothetical protein MJ579_18560 [Klebsiella pneumoniae]|nr:hypothetical protein MJ579_18560 [Klebsiella pneumoniae]
MSPRAPYGAGDERRGALEVACRLGTPRIANRLLRRVRDFAEVRHDGTISADIAAYRRWICLTSMRKGSTIWTVSCRWR